MSNLSVKFQVISNLVSPSKAVKVIFNDDLLATHVIGSMDAIVTIHSGLLGKKVIADFIKFAFDHYKNLQESASFVALLHTQLTPKQSEKLSGTNLLETLITVAKKAKVITGTKEGNGDIQPIDSRFLELLNLYKESTK